MKHQSLFLVIITVAFFSCSKSGGSKSAPPNNSSNVTVSTFAGNTSTSTFSFGPSGICSDKQGNIFVSIPTGGVVMKITSTGVLSTFAGTNGNFGFTNGTGAAASFTSPIDLCIDAGNNMYVADYLYLGIRRISPTAVVSDFASSNSSAGVYLDGPQAIASDPQGNIYSADQAGSDGITKSAPDGTVSHFAGSSTSGYLDGPVATAEFSPLGITGICADGSGNVYVADNNLIRKISGGQVTTLAGAEDIGYVDGTGTTARFGGAMGLCLDAKGNIYVADTYNYVIRMITPAGVVTTVAGTGQGGTTDGPGSAAQFYEPVHLCFDPQGNLYVSDFGNNLVRKIVFK